MTVSGDTHLNSLLRRLAGQMMWPRFFRTERWMLLSITSLLVQRKLLNGIQSRYCRQDVGLLIAYLSSLRVGKMITGKNGSEKLVPLSLVMISSRRLVPPLHIEC